MQQMTEEEYVQKIQSLHETALVHHWPQEKTEEEEFRLTIQYRLGRDFPEERIEKLCRIWRDIHKQRDALAMRRVAREIGFIRTQYGVWRLLRRTKAAFREELSGSELEKLFG